MQDLVEHLLRNHKRAPSSQIASLLPITNVEEPSFFHFQRGVAESDADLWLLASIGATLGALLVAAVCGLMWRSPWEPREPVYDGKPLSYWIVPFGPMDIPTPLPPTLLRDSNAVPLLIAELHRRDRPFRRLLSQTLYEHADSGGLGGAAACFAAGSHPQNDASSPRPYE